MVRPQQFNNKIKPEQPSERHTGHPLLKNDSQTTELLKRFQQQQESDEAIIERIEEWKDSLNRLASTADGQHFLKMMIKHGGIFTPRNTSNTVKMVEDAGKSAFYLKYVRPYLDAAHRQEIE